MTAERKKTDPGEDPERTPSPSDISADSIQKRIAEYDEQVEKLNRQLVQVQRELSQAKERRAALSLTLDEYGYPERRQSPLAATREDILAIQGRTVRQALIIFAERHGNMLESGEARRALELAGIVDAMSPNQIWKELKLLRRFKQLRRGKYKLLPAEPATGTLWKD